MDPVQQNQVDKSSLLVEQLVESGCIKFGNFTLKSGLTSPYYVDLREVTMHPSLFNTIIESLQQLLDTHKPCGLNAGTPCALVGVPYGVVPIAAALAYTCKLRYYPVRKEVKDYGHKPDSSSYDLFEFILVEDVMSTGSSIIDTLKKMEGKKITDVVVIIDRELGGRDKLAKEYPDIKVHSLLKISDVLKAVNRKGAT